MGSALVIATLKLGSTVSHQMTNAAHEIRSHNATSAAPSGEAEPKGKSKGKGKGKGKGQFK